MHENNKMRQNKAEDETVSAQYSRAEKDSAVVDISGRGKLVLGGKDHLKFLQGMLTNDVLKPRDGEGAYSFMLNQKGRVLTDMRLFRKERETLVDIEAQAAEKTALRLETFKLSYKVDIARDENRALFHLFGQRAEEAIVRFLDCAVKIKQFDHFDSTVAGARVWMARVDRSGKTGFDIEAEPGNSGKILELLKETGVFPASPEVLEIMRVEAGIPRYGKDMDESVIAPETGLLQAVSFEKGCYVGQEIVARAHWRGRVNRQLSGFLFRGQTVPREETGIVSLGGDAIGRITSSVYSPRFGVAAMGYIRREFKSVGTEIKTETGLEGKVADFSPDG